jgi:hypothetical protein
MRYREGSVADPQSHSQLLEPMHMGTVVLGLMIGLILYTMARRARILWLVVWGGGLVAASLAYMGYAVISVW